MPAGKRPLIWSPEARADLADIWTHYAGAAGLQTADKIVRDIHAACRPLEHFPLAGRTRDELRHGLRSLAVRPHVVFYRVVDGVPEIGRVLDGRRDLDEIFAAP
jgi:toxin ParE1/3/4